MQINRNWIKYLKDYSPTVNQLFWSGRQDDFLLMCDALDESGHPAAAALVRDLYRTGGCTRETILRVFSFVHQNQRLSRNAATYFWTTKDDTKIRWVDMTPQHLVSVACMLVVPTRDHRDYEVSETRRQANRRLPSGLLLELYARDLWPQVEERWQKFIDENPPVPSTWNTWGHQRAAISEIQAHERTVRPRARNFAESGSAQYDPTARVMHNPVLMREQPRGTIRMEFGPESRLIYCDEVGGSLTLGDGPVSETRYVQEYYVTPENAQTIIQRWRDNVIDHATAFYSRRGETRLDATVEWAPNAQEQINALMAQGEPGLMNLDGQTRVNALLQQMYNPALGEPFDDIAQE